MLPVAVSAETSGLLPGTTYTATLIAASAEGSSSGASVTFTTPSAAPGAGSGAASATTLSVSALKLSPTRFRRGRRAATIASRTARSALLPSASKISFALSAPATATLSFERAERGVLVGHRCSAPSARHRSGRRCTRYAKITHALSLPAHAGSDHVTFDGVLDGGLRLAPGRYRLSLGATAAGARAVATQHPLFTPLS